MNEETMAEWMKYASPSDEHDFLKRLAGTWKARVRLYFDPDAPPQEHTGTMTSEMILEGRYLRSDYDGDPGPMGVFLGMGLDGYDRVRGKYIGIWADTMGTGWMAFEGDVDGDVRTMHTTVTMPGGATMKQRALTTIVSKKEYRYESFVETPAGEFRNMEIVYKR